MARISSAQARKLGIVIRGGKPKLTLSSILNQPSLYRLTMPHEQRLSCDLYARLLREHEAGHLRGTFSCIPAELPIPTWTEELKKIAATIQFKRQVMGVVEGVPDWVFVWDTGGGWLELKRPMGDATMKVVERVGGPKLHPVRTSPGRLSDTQKIFAEWCRVGGVKHAVGTSVDECMAVLQAWGNWQPN